MTEPHRFEIRVYAEDTDFMGLVYHSNFLCFLERARSELIRSSGQSLIALAAHQCHFAISEVELRYLYPARLDDLLTVTTRIENKKSCSLVFAQVIHNQHNRVLCEAKVKVVCIDDEMKPRRLPEQVF